MIYWDHNAATPCAPEVVKAMRRYWSEDYGNPSSSHMMGRRAAAAIKKARELVGNLIDCPPSEIIFTSGATESNNLLFLGVLLTPRSERNQIVISAIEHKSVLGPARLLEEHGFDVIKLPVSRAGVTDLKAARNLVTEKTLLVSVQAANNELGTLQPIAKLADLAHENGAYFHTDAAQILGKLPFDVQTVNCDFASFSAHKIYGPKGAGALFVRGGARRWPWARPFRGGGQETGLRPGTSNVPAIVGFGEACSASQRYIQKELFSEIAKIEKELIAQIKSIFPKIVIHSIDELRLPGVFSIAFPSIPADLLVDHLQALSVGKGAACSGGSIAPSHVLTEIGCDSKLSKSTLRISIGRDTTHKDMREAIGFLSQSFNEIRKNLCVQE